MANSSYYQTTQFAIVAIISSRPDSGKFQISALAAKLGVPSNAIPILSKLVLDGDVNMRGDSFRLTKKGEKKLALTLRYLTSVTELMRTVKEEPVT